MNNVYVLLIERSSTRSATDTYINGVYSSEKKAWEEIETRYKTLSKLIPKRSLGRIWFAEFRGKSFILCYHTLFGEVVYVKYIIDKRSIK